MSVTLSEAEMAPFPFGPDFQLKVLKVFLMNQGGSSAVLEHLRPNFFQSPEMRWACASIQEYWKKYRRMPTMDVLRHAAGREADRQLASTLGIFFEQLSHTTINDFEYIRDELVKWARMNHFYAKHRDVHALWNSGKRTEAMALDAERANEGELIEWRQEEVDFWGEEVAERERYREYIASEYGDTGLAISTGVAELDKMMSGGLRPGELGVWIALAKGGKSTMLSNLGAVALTLYKNVLHIVLEGSKEEVNNRYDAWFAQEDQWKVKLGQMSPEAYARLHVHATRIRKRLVIRGLLEKFGGYTVEDIYNEIQILERHYGWRPDMVIVDYGDLLHGRSGPYRSNHEREADAFRDLKLLANRGYAVWTASQVQRPDRKNFDTDPNHIIRFAEVAGSIEKARACDFLGSLNATVQEREEKTMRVYAELYRHGEGHKLIRLETEPFQGRLIGVVREAPIDAVGAGLKEDAGVAPVPAPFGYGAIG